ncbi:MAG TPA: hypothetical protein DEA26_03665 [Oceanospirillales bacterium]|nr:hypothetical protein [Oceanospirillaceae bacterium]HBS41753.1 hypothetical protein [Oceanospirillales bacterium]|tara:strand:+ start:96835 stop:98172 length:1338 start_codon:yes stop_codon:yes gene_type:complete
MVRWYRSFFFRVFLWFWVIVFLAMIAVAGTIQWLDDDYYRQASIEETRLLARILDTRPPILVEERRFWRRLSPGWNLVTVPLDSLGQLPHDIEEFAEIAADRGQILWGQDSGWLMIGPVRRGNDLYIAVARKAWQSTLMEKGRWVVPLVVIGVVTLLCFLLAWSQTRPVLKLQRAVRRLARGDFDMTALKNSYRRHDELGALTDEVIDMALALQRLLNSHQQLLRDVSHELRSPLTRLQIALGLARKKDKDGLLTNEHNRIERALGQVNGLISQMLDLAKLQQQDQQQLEAEDGDLVEYLTEWLEDADIECHNRGLTVNRNWRIREATACWDWLLVERAFDNILRNAIRFSPEGAELNISCGIIKDRAFISVGDRGPGVPDDELSRIFDPFTQVDSARDHATGGYGIGLALVKRIVELHHGEVTASNTYPGLKVTLSLPLIVPDR